MGALKSRFKLRSKASPILEVARGCTSEGRCSICQETIGNPLPDGVIETWAMLPCGHAFGSFCIKTWLGLAEQPSCPVCRRDMQHACGHPCLPRVVTRLHGLPRKPAQLSSTCFFCTKARWKNPRQGVVGRAVIRAITVLAADKFKDRLDRIYWEVWRKNQSREFGQWWALQEPPTEPAVAASPQGWAVISS